MSEAQGRFLPRVWIKARDYEFREGFGQFINDPELLNPGIQYEEYLSKEEATALAEARVREATKELADAAEQLVFGGHGRAYLPGQMERFTKALNKARAQKEST